MSASWKSCHSLAWLLFRKVCHTGNFISWLQKSNEGTASSSSTETSACVVLLFFSREAHKIIAMDRAIEPARHFELFGGVAIGQNRLGSTSVTVDQEVCLVYLVVTRVANLAFLHFTVRHLAVFDIIRRNLSSFLASALVSACHKTSCLCICVPYLLFGLSWL